MHLPAAMDGGPHQMIEPGGIWFPSWQVDQPAATLWYHPHLHGETAEHVYRELAGMFLIDDPDAAPALPRNYGVDELPVIVQDKSFTDDGQLDERAPLLSPTGFLGDTVVVNGTIGPYAEVTTETVRLRLLNASNARIYDFGLVGPDGRPHDFVLVGTDGGLLPAPVPAERVGLSPGERRDRRVDDSGTGPHAAQLLARPGRGLLQRALRRRGRHARRPPAARRRHARALAGAP